ncbi:cupin domain-containing protein, partial [Phenylobacterium sp.]|uniref:cupin domain-containing protein n=1 Tax=Phenylobacterium sp. TaxID=1871053 RepID=UPI003982DA08
GQEIYVSDPKHLVRTHALDWSQAFHGRHPFNPDSDMRMAPLGDAVGLKRAAVHLMRVAPGKQSFIPHAHAVQEEWVFILEGSGEVVLDGAATAIGPGDFIGFPIDGVVHHLANTGSGDLTYLTGGERGAFEIAEMPTIGRTAVFRGGRISLYGPGGIDELSEQEWRARSRLD